MYLWPRPPLSPVTPNSGHLFLLRWSPSTVTSNSGHLLLLLQSLILFLKKPRLYLKLSICLRFTSLHLSLAVQTWTWVQLDLSRTPDPSLICAWTQPSRQSALPPSLRVVLVPICVRRQSPRRSPIPPLHPAPLTCRSCHCAARDFLFLYYYYSAIVPPLPSLPLVSSRPPLWPKRTMTCHYCGILGPFERDCWK